MDPYTRKVYYEKHYPFHALCEILKRGGKDLTKREFAAVGAERDIWRRHLHPNAQNSDLAVNEIKEELRSQRYSERRVDFDLKAIHIGAVFSQQPQKNGNGVPQQRELTIDIDSTDYPHLHTSKDDLKGCDAVWPVIAFGLDLIGSFLEQEFGYSEFVRFYSGRRGAHMWVLDDHACRLTQDARVSIEELCNLRCDKSGVASDKTLDTARIYGYFEGCVEFFETVCLKSKMDGGLGLLDDEADVQAFFDLSGIRHSLLAHLPSTACSLTSDGVGRWRYIRDQVQDACNNLDKMDWARNIMNKTMLAYVWPRIDAKVTTGLNHTVKAPFSIHPATGRVCVPIFGSAYEFDPSSVVTARQVLEDETARERVASDVDRFLSELGKQPVDHPTKGKELPPLKTEDEEDGVSTEEMDIEDLCGPSSNRRDEIQKVDAEYEVTQRAWFLKVCRSFHLQKRGETLVVGLKWELGARGYFSRFTLDRQTVSMRSDDDEVGLERLVSCAKRLHSGSNSCDVWHRILKDDDVYLVLPDPNISDHEAKQKFKSFKSTLFNKHIVIATMDLSRHETSMRSHFDLLLSNHRNWVLTLEE